MKHSRFIIVIVILFISTVCFAQVKHPIDKFEEDEIAKDSTTAGMANASVKAREKWDAEMNKYYKLLMSILDKKSKEILKTSQKAWVEYRDKEFKNIQNIYTQLQGTMYIPMESQDKTEIVKSRALELKAYYELLKNK
jgi:uncharacterized protein YecT (DUF1311 family)